MLEQIISNWFKKNQWTWAIGGGMNVPTEQDIQDALDEAARLLYDEPVGTQLSVGRLIIEKTASGHDVYMLAGEYY